jgi:hypothetical protein
MQQGFAAPSNVVSRRNLIAHVRAYVGKDLKEVQDFIPKYDWFKALQKKSGNYLKTNVLFERSSRPAQRG